MHLIVNADDYGYTKSVSDGIVYGHKNGIISSTTVMCNMPYVEYGCSLAKECPNLGFGVHLNLTVGQPLTDNKTLCDTNGNFLDKVTIRKTQIDRDELYGEWKAQIEKFISVFKQLPTHLDSHHSVHDFNEFQLDVSSQLANEYGIPMRRYSDYAFSMGFFGDSVSVRSLMQLLENNRNDKLELMVHPGFCDLELYRDSSYNFGRVKELDVLCDSDILEYVNKKGIVLEHY